MFSNLTCDTERRRTSWHALIPPLALPLGCRYECSVDGSLGRGKLPLEARYV
jgi:hypothetical protein